MMWKLLLAMVVVGVLATSAAAERAAPSYVINGDARIGAFSTWKHGGKLALAISAFGEPTTLEPARAAPGSHPALCFTGWPRLGLSITFYWYAPLGSACVPENGCFLKALITSSRWVTTRGLRVGDDRRRLYALYPNLRLRASGWRTLIIREYAAPFDTFSAKLVNGRVSAFRIRGYACGI